ncbi:MAG TPA: EamA family transporter [Myxococcales bacterium]|nr:EamA family transporter [Myxococcales bacterium]
MTRGIAWGLLAAVVFGASVPLTKILAGAADPLVIAGLLYLGAGGALAAVRGLRRGVEAPLRRQDAPWLAGIVLSGAVAGPALLVVGLRRLPGVPGALFLNLEAPLTALLAVIAFHEHLSRRGWAAVVLLAAGATVLAAGPGALSVDGLGAAALTGACAAWALDTNLTQRLSIRDPVALVRFKGLAGGACTLALGLALGGAFPQPRAAIAALAVGAIGYGASVVWHVQAMRVLGAARQSALFATAPFAAALFSVPLLSERLGPRDGIAAAFMGVGVFLLLREKHAHAHVHEPVEHEHLHVHDEHHRHSHDGSEAEPHSHPHVHERLEHSHPHASDVHHRHRH